MANPLYYLASAPCFIGYSHKPHFPQALSLDLSHFFSSTWTATFYFSTIHHLPFPYWAYSNSFYPSHLSLNVTSCRKFPPIPSVHVTCPTCVSLSQHRSLCVATAFSSVSVRKRSLSCFPLYHHSLAHDSSSLNQRAGKTSQRSCQVSWKAIFDEGLTWQVSRGLTGGGVFLTSSQQHEQHALITFPTCGTKSSWGCWEGA